jgi:group I intron endonuclease
MLQSGIYVIRNLVNGKVYVGSSVNIKHRRENHFSSLRRGSHINKHLQRAYNHYGPDAFEFQVVEQVQDADSLLAREQHWIDVHSAAEPDMGYNKASLAGWCPPHVEDRAILQRQADGLNGWLDRIEARPQEEEER